MSFLALSKTAAFHRGGRLPAITLILFLSAPAFWLQGLQSPARADAPPASGSPPHETAWEPKTAQDYFRMGQISANLNNSIQYLSKAIDLDPNYTEAYAWRGQVFMAQKQYDQALADFNQAISLNPRHAEYYVSRANLFLRQDKYAPALADLNQALRLDPKNFSAYLARGRIQVHQGNLDQALSDFDQAVRLSPLDAAPFYERGKVRLAQQVYGPAIADFSKAVAFHPRYAEAYYYRAQAYQTLGESAKAQADLEKFRFLKPDAKTN